MFAIGQTACSTLTNTPGAWELMTSFPQWQFDTARKFQAINICQINEQWTTMNFESNTEKLNLPRPKVKLTLILAQTLTPYMSSPFYLVIITNLLWDQCEWCHLHVQQKHQLGRDSSHPVVVYPTPWTKHVTHTYLLLTEFRSYCKWQTKSFPLIYGPSMKRAGHNSTGKKKNL